MVEITLPDFLVFCGSTLLMAMLLMELLDWSCISAVLECAASREVPGPFVYGEQTGPSYWGAAYPEARGCQQSPVNIVSRQATVFAPCEALHWCGYADEPLSFSIANDGNTVVLFGFWTCTSRPNIQGGPLQCVYEFQSLLFRWGPGDDEGSEHSIDYVHYPLEMQALHTRRGLETVQDATTRKIKDGILIISYFFQITASDNPYLDHVVTNLWRVASPGTCAHVPAFPLEWLIPSFERKFYTYRGSLTYPPCTEIVTWIIHPEPIAISAAQVAKFRNICSVEGPILTNSRPVQMLNNREIYYYA